MSDHSAVTTLLRLAPLLSSTVQLTFAIAEGTVYALILRSRPTAYANAIYPSFFTINTPRALIFVLGSNFASIAGAATNLRYFAKAGKGFGGELLGLDTKTWYSIGLAGTIGHLLFIPLVVPLIQQLVAGGDIGDGPIEGDADDMIKRREKKRIEMGVTRKCDEIMAQWLKFHWVRCFVADGLAWVAYLGGVVSLFR